MRWATLNLVLGFSFLAGGVWAQPAQKQVTFDSVIGLARERAGKAYAAPKVELPEELRGEKLNYDTYRQIEFKHDRALWLKEELPFRLEFYHPGYLYQTPVKIHEFNSTHVQPIRFVQDFFKYGGLKFEKRIPADAGYAGFRLLHPVNDGKSWDEVASFLGSSYFRMLGKGLHYGASARGLALNSGEAGVKEEFPVFVEWWLQKPEKGNNTAHFFGLLDSASCAGAYEFLLRPGETTVSDVSAVVFMRAGAEVKTFGMAPLTSMFWFGENSETRADDYRPEVHDSDGLLIRGENDEFTWRPLRNPKAIEHQVIAVNNARGFGLMQRDRNFSSYQDTFNFYHLTPSVWVEPRGNWGAGEVHLVELPTNYEGMDNIVAFWNPKEKPSAGREFRFAYTLHWAGRPEVKFAPCKVAQTRMGRDPGDQKKRQVVIDFEPGEALPLTAEIPKAEVSGGDAVEVTHAQVFKNEIGKSWRVIFSLSPKAGAAEAVDIRCALKAGERTVSEVWRYPWKALSIK